MKDPKQFEIHYFVRRRWQMLHHFLWAKIS